MLSPANEVNARVMLTIANAGPGSTRTLTIAFPGMAVDFVTTDRLGRAVGARYSAQLLL